MEYQVVFAVTNYAEEEVNALLKDGWRLQGGASVSIDSNDGQIYLCQAMVK